MTPQERAALVARLRVLAGTSERGGPLYADDDVSKAADQIEADGKNLESGFFGRMAAQATKDRRIAVERAEVLAQQVATLRTALEPFAKIATDAESWAIPGQPWPDHVTWKCSPTMGSLRAANAALRASEAKVGELSRQNGILHENLKTTHSTEERAVEDAAENLRIAVVQQERAEKAEATNARLREIISDLLALKKGHIAGSAQDAEIVREAEAALTETSGPDLAQTEPKVTT